MRATDMHSRHVTVEYGITVPQLVCLESVVETPGQTPGQLAKTVHLSQSTCVGILDRLESKGYIHRSRDVKDRRRVCLVPTDAGREMYSTAPSLLQSSLAEKFVELPRHEQERLVDALQQITSMMDIDSVDAAPLLEVGTDIVPRPDVRRSLTDAISPENTASAGPSEPGESS